MMTDRLIRIGMDHRWLWRTAILIAMVFLVTVLPKPALAQGPASDGVRVQLGSNLTLEEDESLDGGVIVLGGNFTMKEGSEVEGDVIVFGGNVEIQGQVKGNVASFGGNVRVLDEGIVEGDVASVGGNVSAAETAKIEGDVVTNEQFNFDNGVTIPPIPGIAQPDVPDMPDVPDLPSVANEPGFSPQERETYSDFRSQNTMMARVGRFFGDGFEDIFGALIIAGLSVLIVLFFPKNAQTIQETLNQATGVSFVVGIVTLPVTATVLVLLAVLSILIVPICGFIIVAVGLAVALLAGWAVIGKYLGSQIFSRFNNPRPSEISATFLGAVILTLVGAMPFIDHLPFFGWLFWLIGFLVSILVGSTGLGAVILSRFGTRAYQPASSGVLAAIDRNVPLGAGMASTPEAVSSRLDEPSLRPVRDESDEDENLI